MEFTKFLYHLKITSWNQSYTKLFTKEIGFTEIFQKVVIQKFRKIRSESSTVVWKNEKFSLAENFFREINSYVTSLVELLLSRNFWQKSVKEDYRNFYTMFSQSPLSVLATKKFYICSRSSL